jgi:hypothetical protein
METNPSASDSRIRFSHSTLETPPTADPSLAVPAGRPQEVTDVAAMGPAAEPVIADAPHIGIEPHPSTKGLVVTGSSRWPWYDDHEYRHTLD